MKVYIYTLTILIALLAVSCGNSVNPANNIALAREAIAHGDYNDALSALDEARSVMSDSTASAIALTETAALYCVIDEKLQSEDYIDKALGCYGLAVSINPDSASPAGMSGLAARMPDNFAFQSSIFIRLCRCR